MNDLEGDVSPWKEQTKILDGYSLEASVFDTCLILLLVRSRNITPCRASRAPDCHVGLGDCRPATTK